MMHRAPNSALLLTPAELGSESGTLAGLTEKIASAPDSHFI